MFTPSADLPVRLKLESPDAEIRSSKILKETINRGKGPQELLARRLQRELVSSGHRRTYGGAVGASAAH